MSFWDLGPVVLPRLSIFLWWAGSRIPYFSRFAGRPRISTGLPLSLMYAQRCVIGYLKRALFFLTLKVYHIYIIRQIWLFGQKWDKKGPLFPTLNLPLFQGHFHHRDIPAVGGDFFLYLFFGHALEAICLIAKKIS